MTTMGSGGDLTKYHNYFGESQYAEKKTYKLELDIIKIQVKFFMS